MTNVGMEETNDKREHDGWVYEAELNVTKGVLNIHIYSVYI